VGSRIQSTVALALAGGNALGAYGAGAYKALHERSYLPDVISGASIGAINGAIIAGDAPERRIEKLRELWNQAAKGSAFGFAPRRGKPREIYNMAHALQTLLLARPGLFTPRVPGLMSSGRKTSCSARSRCARSRRAAASIGCAT
jgi:NTE family protein